jgi:Glycosyl transferase family 2
VNARVPSTLASTARPDRTRVVPTPSLPPDGIVRGSTPTEAPDPASLWAHHPAELDEGVNSLPAGCPRVSVVIPARNEAANLPWVLARIPEGVAEVVLVDGNSTDGTVEVARQLRPDILVVRQTRSGKGNALACGFAAATGDILVMLDADGSAHPAEILAFVDALLSGADVAKGTRFRPGGGSSDITRIRKAGNDALSRLVNVLFGTRFSDLCYGYNAFWAHCLPYLDLPSTEGDETTWGDGFEVETLINVRTARSPLVVDEVASYESCRLHGVSNLNALRDGLRVLRIIGSERWTATITPSGQPRRVPAYVVDPYPVVLPVQRGGRRRRAEECA